MSNNSPLLKIEKLSKNFGGIQAVKDFSLEIEPGALHCLIGPNGAGKTTVFKMIMGSHLPSSGTIFFKQKNISQLSPHARALRGLSLKMQVPGIFADLTLRENLRVALGVTEKHKNIAREVDRLIDLVNLQNIGDPFAKNMSHGQQQWLEFAMVLATKPELLLLDEPAAGLGPEETEYTANLVKKLNSTGLTILFIEHDMNFVKQVARSVTVMHEGKMFMEGTIKEIEKHTDVIRIYLGK